MTKSKPRILLTRRLHDFALEELKRRYSVFVHNGKIPMPQRLLKEKIKDVDGLVCFPYDVIDKEILDVAKNLKVISTYSVGYDHIDLAEAKLRGIKIGYTPVVLTNATADLTIALMVDLMRRVTEGDRLIRAGKWSVIFGAYDYVGMDLEGKTLGIFGMGRIGQAVAKRANAFGMRIIYHSRNRLSRSLENKLHAKYVNFDELIRKSDVLSIHVPYKKETAKIINIKIFKKMKKSALLVNTARGKIVNESDLIRALRSKLIAGAALDVFEREPLDKHSPLIKMENVVLAPHIGSSTAETRAKMAQITVQNLVLGLKGKKMIYFV
ncbi:MAG: 2-hydroxyacid dehydrogenase [Candidatus Nitrosotenuis sp.]